MKNDNIKFLCLATIMLIASFAAGFFFGVDTATAFITDKQSAFSRK